MDLSKTPALAPPPGVTSNFVNPESRGNLILAFGVLSLALMIPFVTVRFCTKIWITRTLGADDGEYFMIQFGIYRLLINVSCLFNCNGSFKRLLECAVV